MTTTGKAALALIILVIIIVIGLVSHMKGSDIDTNNLTTPVTPDITPGPVMSDPRDTSDEAIANDMKAIAAEMIRFDVDLATTTGNATSTASTTTSATTSPVIHVGNLHVDNAGTMLQTISVKLGARLALATTTPNYTLLQSTLADIGTKITDAQTQALKNGVAALKIAKEDLLSAIDDANKIIEKI